MRIGIDVIVVSRMERLLERFPLQARRRFLTEEESFYAKTAKQCAVLWSVKEAVSKALGCGIGKEFNFSDVRVSKTEKGAPYLVFSEKAQKNFDITESSVSITHDGGLVIAAVIIN